MTAATSTQREKGTKLEWEHKRKLQKKWAKKKETKSEEKWKRGKKPGKATRTNGAAHHLFGSIFLIFFRLRQKKCGKILLFCAKTKRRRQQGSAVRDFTDLLFFVFTKLCYGQKPYDQMSPIHVLSFFFLSPSSNGIRRERARERERDSDAFEWRRGEQEFMSRILPPLCGSVSKKVPCFVNDEDDGMKNVNWEGPGFMSNTTKEMGRWKRDFQWDRAEQKEELTKWKRRGKAQNSRINKQSVFRIKET